MTSLNQACKSFKIKTCIQMCWCHLQVITQSPKNKLPDTHIFHIFPSALTYPCEVFTGFPGWWICMWFIVIESSALLGSISHSAVLDVSMLTSCFWCLARQSSFIRLFILESLLYTVQMKGGISNAYQVAKQTCLFKIFPFTGQSIRNSYFSFSAARKRKLACPSVFTVLLDNVKITLYGANACKLYCTLIKELLGF